MRPARPYNIQIMRPLTSIHSEIARWHRMPKAHRNAEKERQQQSLLREKTANRDE